jgi:hypothetical protein
MQLIEIQGPKETLQGILDVKGLLLSIHSAEQQSDGSWRLSGYATDSAITELRRRGCLVQTIMTHEDVSVAIARGRGNDRATPR